MKSIKEKDLTPWFPGYFRPARPGVYMQKSGFDKKIGFQRWDGEFWYAWCESVAEAARTTSRAHRSFQNDPWRGLNKP